MENWMKEVDAACARIAGVGIDDLPDCCFADWYEDGLSPVAAARRAIRACNGEE